MPGTLVQIWPAALENVPIVERDKMLRRISMLLGLKAKNVPRRSRSACRAIRSRP